MRQGPDMVSPSAGTEVSAREPHAMLVHARKLVRWTLIGLMAATGALVIGFAFFADHIGRLSAPLPVPEADGIIVLTGGSQRIQTAVDLLSEGKGKRLLISGVNPQTTRDLLRKETGASPQLFNCCVDLDIAALDTIGNADEGAKWISRNHFSSIILVTNNYHMPRSVMELGRKVDGVAITAFPVVNSSLDDGSWMRDPAAVRVLFTEYTKYLAAVARGVTSQAGNAAKASAH
ncbi:MAG: YdcF family protein [Notoacmeibacter sp.]|nr:YdcF family protein [Notoacmeibacter sp.]